MIFDDLRLHPAGTDLAVHLAPLPGLYFAWLAMQELLSPLRHNANRLAGLRARQMSGVDYLLDNCQGQLRSQDLNASGAQFTAWYYARQSAADHAQCLSSVVSLPECPLAAYWEQYDQISPQLNRRLIEWQRQVLSSRLGPKLELGSGLKEMAAGNIVNTARHALLKLPMAVAKRGSVGMRSDDFAQE